MDIPIQKMEPDFVIEVNGSGEVFKQSVKKLLLKLEEKSFYTQVRQGYMSNDAASLLIFCRLSSSKFSEEFEKDLMRNYEFGVTAKNKLFVDQVRIIGSLLTNSPQSGGIGITPGAGEWLFVSSVTPVTKDFECTRLPEDLENAFKKPYSVHEVRNQYGVQVALYFEFLRFYTWQLLYLSVFGIVSYFKKKRSLLLTYTLINLGWGVVFITLWNKRQLYLVNFWGVQNSHLVEEYNTELASVNEKFEQKSSYKHKEMGNVSRFLKQLAFIPVALLFTLILVCYQLLCFVLEIFLTEIYDGPGKILLTLLPTILISVFLPVLTITYKAVCVPIVEWEGHDDEYSRSSSQLIKSFVLTFLSSYMPLVITSFIYLPFAHLIKPNIEFLKESFAENISDSRFYKKYLLQIKNQEEFKMNQERLNVQFFYFVVTNQIIQAILKYALPLIIGQVKYKIESYKSKKSGPPKVKDVTAESKWLESVRKILALPEYDVNEDFRGLILQYGYLIMFGPVWPLAPLISIAFNLLTFELDKSKLASGKYFKPSVATRVDSIYPWSYALFGLTWIGSIISPLVTTFYRHGTKPPKIMGKLGWDHASVNLNGTKSLIVAFFCEHAFFLLWCLLSKFFSMSKSEIEWDNDFIDNDIKLRRDVYSDKVKLSIEPRDDNKWEELGSLSSISSAMALMSDIVPHSGSRSVEDQEQGLHKVKDDNDSFVYHKNHLGSVVVSTMDSNKHIDPSDEEKDAESPNGNGINLASQTAGSGLTKPAEHDNAHSKSVKTTESKSNEFDDKFSKGSKAVGASGSDSGALSQKKSVIDAAKENVKTFENDAKALAKEAKNNLSQGANEVETKAANTVQGSLSTDKKALKKPSPKFNEKGNDDNESVGSSLKKKKSTFKKLLKKNK